MVAQPGDGNSFLGAPEEDARLAPYLQQRVTPAGQTLTVEGATERDGLVP